MNDENKNAAKKPSLVDFFEEATGGEMYGEIVPEGTYEKLEKALGEYPELAFEKGWNEISWARYVDKDIATLASTAHKMSFLRTTVNYVKIK